MKRFFLPILMIIFCFIITLPASADSEKTPNSWYFDTITEHWYYIEADGSYAKGWKLIGNTWYYFDLYDNIMCDNTFIVWDSGINDYKHYLALPNGAVVLETNTWYYNQYTGYWFYMEADGSIAWEWKKIGDFQYYFSPWGMADTSFQVWDYNTGTQRVYVAEKSGRVVLDQGWYYHIDDRVWYYVTENGWILSDGFYEIEGNTHCFETYGELKTGLFYYNGIHYISNDKGALFTTPGWANYNDNWYWVKDDGTAAYNEKITLEDYSYCFDWDCKMVVGFYSYYDKASQSNISIFCDEHGHIAEQTSQWYTFNNVWVYMKEDGTFAKNEILTINGIQYGFDENSIMYGSTPFYIDSKYYYAQDNGIIATDGWIKGGFDYYYANSDGTLAKGWLLINDTWYHFKPEMTVGTFYDGDYDSHYAFDDKGVQLTGIGNWGWTLIDGIWYYYPTANEKYTGWCGEYYIENNRMLTNKRIDLGYDSFYLNKYGICERGWIYKEQSDKTDYYYADAYGRLQSGWEWIDGVWYYFSPYNYQMYYDDILPIPGEDRYAEFDKSGAFIGYINYNQWHLTSDGRWYYLTSSNEPINNWHTIGGIRYHFNYSYMDTNCYVWDHTVSQYIWLNNNGIRDYGSGWRQDNLGYWHYIENGIVFNDGYKTIDGNEYYFSTGNSEMYVGLEYVYNETTREYEYVIFNAYGVKEAVPQNGWYLALDDKEENRWFYFINGELINSGYHNINGMNYYFDDKGAMITGAYRHSGNSISENVYLFNTSGQLVTDQWLLIDGYWYYANAYGRALTGERVINGVTYHFDYSGKMI